MSEATMVTPTEVRLRRVSPAGIPDRRSSPVDAATHEAALAIVEDVRAGGEDAVRRHAERLGDIAPGEPLTLDRAAMERAAADVPREQIALLERVAGRIERFARAQREAIAPVRVPVPGGWAGHRVQPVDGAGCYAPGGRFPLPSSMLMTVITARAAGVATAWAASPRPAPITIAAALVAGADGLLAVGGAQAIAALAYGAGPVPAADTICGPVNRFVTAAKRIVAADRRIDMLAGPSELLLVADATADPETVAADLLAQAEHDPDAIPVLLATDAAVIDAVDAALGRRLAVLSTRDTAARALENGYAILADDVDAVVAACDAVAPEHLQLSCADPHAIAARLRHYGGLFVGEAAAEVLGDYGAGPNHTLPTGGTARLHAGLSVMDFLRLQTTLAIDHPEAAAPLAADARALAELEGLAGHAAAAGRRIGGA
jgi:phosphoribosyl-ATP pyrophosphohydrolase/phosphoribosyl-AMP cyclohydrolase/histidinol dehydrogenase